MKYPIRSLGFVVLILFLVLTVFLAKNAFSEDIPSAPEPANKPAVAAAASETPRNSSEIPRNSEEMAPLFLGQGEQRVLRVEGLKRYSVGGSAVRAHSLGDELLVKGTSPGLSDLWVWKSDGASEHRTIRVQKEIGAELKPALERSLGYLQEVEVLVSGPQVILRGEVRSQAEAARIASLLTGFPADIHDEVQVSDTLLNESQARLQNWIQATKNSSRLTIERAQGALWVRGSIDRPTERARVEKQLQGIFPLVQTELDSMPDTAPTVHFKVYLMEIKKNRHHNIGLGWPPAQEGAFHVTTSSIQDQIGLDLTLNALADDGSAKILSSPELVVRAPGEAELFAGGEIPIRMESHFYSNVTWKTFGLSLKLKVTHTTLERVRLEIFTENSRIDPTLAQDKVPGIQSNRMKTEVDAQYGVPLLLSGLLQQGTRESARGLPFLHSIPILGLLFGSEDYLSDRSELVAILMPSSSPPPAPVAKLLRLAPKGSVPPPRDWISAQDEKRLKASADYPWNALQ